MNDIQPSFETRAESDAERIITAIQSLGQFVIKLVQVVEDIAQAAVREWYKAETNHNRGELLDAYKVRHNWKKSDASRLITLELNPIAQRKIAHLSGTGRPIVRQHEPLAYRVIRNLGTFGILFGGRASPEERRKAFWQWYLHEFYIEALYRGEHARAKAKGCRDASRTAEADVAEALRVSSSKVHQICGRVRRASGKMKDFPPVSLAEFEAWMRTGQ